MLPLLLLAVGLTRAADITETPQDLPWAAAVRTWEKTPDQSLSDILPELATGLRRDAAIPALRSLWGESLNFDEGVKKPIVLPFVLDDLERTFGTHRTPPARDSAGHRVAHAGLEHTYGYVLNNLPTSFGFKRARWVSGEIERGFGLTEGVIGPSTHAGSFLTNVTVLAGRIAFNGTSEREQALAALAHHAAPELAAFPGAPLQGKRLTETIEARGGRKVTLITDVLPFRTPQKNAALLVYSVSDSSVDHGLPRLITAFPVETAFVDQAFASDKLGSAQTIVTRYNAFVPGISGASFKGMRSVQSNAVPH